MSKRVLIILGDSLGCFVQSTGAIADLKAHFANDTITLLTSRKLQYLADSNPHLDEIVYTEPHPWWNLPNTLRMRSFLKQFDYIYDFQHDEHSLFLLRLAGRHKASSPHPGSKWHVNPQVFREYPLEDALRIQLSLARVPSMQKPDVRYAAKPATEALEAYHLKEGKYIVLIPGSRTKYKAHRWPHYSQLGQILREEGWPLVIVGGTDDKQVCETLAKELQVPFLYNLPLPELIDVFQSSALAIGNDAGAFHLAMACGAEGILLFGPASSANRPMPRASNVQVLHNSKNLAAISPQAVMKTLAIIRP